MLVQFSRLASRHFEPSLDALSFWSDVITSTKIPSSRQISAYQLGFANRGERLRCLGLYRGTLNHADGDVWGRYPPRLCTFVKRLASRRDVTRGGEGGCGAPMFCRRDPPGAGAILMHLHGSNK